MIPFAWKHLSGIICQLTHRSSRMGRFNFCRHGPPVPHDVLTNRPELRHGGESSG